MLPSSKESALADHDHTPERLTRLEVAVDVNSKALAALEVTVAQGFLDSELRDLALSQKIDVTTESLRDEIRTVASTVVSLSDEMHRTTDAIRKEHASDRALLTRILEQHARRLHDLEER